PKYKKIYKRSLAENGGAPWLLLPTDIHPNPGRTGTWQWHFYLQFKDRTYHLDGNAVERLGLEEFFGERWSEMDSRAVQADFEEILAQAHDKLIAAACNALRHHQWVDTSSWALPNEILYAKLEKRHAEKPDSPNAELIVRTVEWLKDLSRERFQKARVQIPDNEYKPGAPVDEAPEGITWSEPNEAGLRLGIAGVAPGGIYPRAQPFRPAFYVRNDSEDIVKLSPSVGGLNQRLRAWLIDTEGKRTHYSNSFEVGAFTLERRWIDPGHYIGLYSSPLAFPVSPGRYRLEAEHHIGQWTDKTKVLTLQRGPGVVPGLAENDPLGAPGLGEWVGILHTPPLELEITTYQAVELKAGSPRVEYGIGSTKATGVFRSGVMRAGVHFEEGRVTVVHASRGPHGRWGAYWKSDPYHVWESESGEYRGAYEVGTTRRLWMIDGDTILCLMMGQVLRETGRWSLAEATGELGGMSDGVRKALRLPAREAN
ncbi:MAG: hypothetical protein P8J87_17265, partial [Verrucomicrobiales bacterium]|nr:hypothetical protein [Verrucomicrobiales bacterium]